MTLASAIRTQARLASAGSNTRVGMVDGYDPNNYCATVVLQPEGTKTGWLPVLSLAIGNGWGVFTPPSPGDLVEVHFLGGDANAGVIAQRFFDNNNRPVHVESGELFLLRKDGVSVKLTKNGTLYLSDKAGSVVVMNGDDTGTMTFAGGLTINANIQVNGSVTSTGDQVAQGISQVGHVHKNVKAGADLSGGPQ